MRLLPVLVMLGVLVGGCTMLPHSGRATAKDLGPSELPAATTASSNAVKQLRAGVSWVWQSVARLEVGIATIQAKAPVEAAALEESLDQVRADCHDAETAVGESVSRAKVLWRKARGAVGSVAATCLSVALKYGLSQLVASLGGGA